MKIGRRLVISAFALLFAVQFAPGSTPASALLSDKHKKEKADANGPAVLWNDPGDITSLDLFYGIGGASNAPDLSAKFTYVGRDKKGTQKKLYVNDDKGGEWIVKFGVEAKPETAATRIVWAMGYHTDEDYFVKRVHIEGLKDDAVDVRFKRRHHGYKDIGKWNWDQNPFLGTRELDGLKVLMLILNNWDLKTSNNKIVVVDKKHDRQPNHQQANDRIYYVGDLGATFGKTGELAREFGLPVQPGSKDKPDQYAHQSFVEDVVGGEVRFNYKGKDPSTVRALPSDHVKWMGGMLARLTDKQLNDALRAAGYDEGQISTLVRALKDRIGQLQTLQ
ncbi:MAG TPA: hypothetical protein VI756_18800 [Blastocatellia bacterium]